MACASIGLSDPGVYKVHVPTLSVSAFLTNETLSSSFHLSSYACQYKGSIPYALDFEYWDKNNSVKSSRVPQWDGISLILPPTSNTTGLYYEGNSICPKHAL